MPPKRNPKMNKKRRNRYGPQQSYARKRFETNRTAIGRSLVPARKTIKLVYTSDTKTPTSNTSIIWNDWALNGMYDPDVTGVGHQPLGFDQMALLYQRYRVHGCMMIMEGQVLTAGTAACILMGYDDLNVKPATLTDAKESKQYKCVISNNERPFKISRYIPISVASGRTSKQINNEDNFVGTFVSNPPDIIYGHTGFINLDGSYTTAGYYRVTLVYYATLFDLVTLAGS